MKSFIDSDFINVILNIKWNEISILNIKSTIYLFCWIVMGTWLWFKVGNLGPAAF